MKTVEWTQTFAEFSPAEVERITGLTADLQRVWRRRGILPERKNTYAKFSVQEVSAIMIRYRLSLRGYSSGETGALAEGGAPHLLWCALMEADAGCEVFGKTGDVDAFAEEYKSDSDIIGRLTGLSPGDARRYLLAFDDEPPALSENLSEAIELSGAQSAFVLNLEEMGKRLAQAAKRPLVTVYLGGVTAADVVGRSRIERRVMQRFDNS